MIAKTWIKIVKELLLINFRFFFLYYVNLQCLYRQQVKNKTKEKRLIKKPYLINVNSLITEESNTNTQELCEKTWGTLTILNKL